MTDFYPIRVLVVDDNDHLRTSLTIALELYTITCKWLAKPSGCAPNFGPMWC
jgi:DNA-binding NtrC family response regulator